MRIRVYLLILPFIGCTSNNKLEDVFTNLEEDEYWGVYNGNNNFKFQGTYVKFYKNGTYKYFGWDIYKKKYEGDPYEIKKWKVTEDSILYFNFRFKHKIVLINEGTIIVTAGKNRAEYIFIKEREKYLRKLDWELDSDSLKLGNPINYYELF